MSDVDKLWELQSLLTQLNETEKQMAVKPESFAAIDREYQSANEEMTRLQGQIDTMGKERRRVDGELSDQQELLKKYQGQLMQVKNQQQYAAAWKEIDATRKHVKELEDSVLKSMTESEGVQKNLDERRAGFDDLQMRYDEAHEAWQHSLGDLKKEAEDLRAKVKIAEEGIPPRLRAEFQKIYKQRGQVAMVKVNSGDTCSSCRSRVRPALAQQLRRGELVFCEGCHRILYWEKVQS
ncbi:MAG TPA: C4-type zinc ribbon domain-containing protein [Thermoanaerobaculia bacterium]|nr:C4-type zinc ribbon domain-containing protein [Thermoanaerobaculia bacterium]